MSLNSNSVLSDHVDAQVMLGSAWNRIEKVIVCIVLAIHTGALVSLPQKLAGGNLPGLGLVWAIGAVLCLIFVAINLKKTLQTALYAWPILALSLWAWLSFNWTIDRYETMRGLLLITSSQLFAFAVAGRFSWEEIIEQFGWTLLTLVTISVLLAIAMPTVGVMSEIHIGAWAGVWQEKQLLGIFASHGIIASISMAALRPKFAWLWLAGASLCVIAIIGSTGRTALLMTAMSIAMGAWLRISNRGVLGAAIAAWIGVICGGIAILAVSGGLDFILHSLGRGTSLTGRTEIWDAVKKLGDMRPMTGWGFLSVWRGEEVMTSPYQWVMDWTDFKPANAHSAWLDIYMQLGKPGFVLLALCMGWAWFGVLFKGAQNHLATAFAGATLMGITFISFTETNLVGAMDLQWLYVPLIGAKLFSSIGRSEQPSPQLAQSGTLEGTTFTFHQ